MLTMLAQYNVPTLRLCYNLAVRCLDVEKHHLSIYLNVSVVLPYNSSEFECTQRRYLKTYMDGG